MMMDQIGVTDHLSHISLVIFMFHSIYNCQYLSLYNIHCRIPHDDMEAKARFLSRWVDSHISDGDHVLKKPVIFTEVGSLVHGSNQGLGDKDILLKTMYDKIYESAKKRQAGAGALVWQLLVGGVVEYSDRFSFVAWDDPSTYKLILNQSCRLKSIFAKSIQSRKHNKDPCSGNLP